MSRRLSLPRSFGLGSVAAFGIVAAHCGAYLFAAPAAPVVPAVGHHHGHHAVEAVATGHQHWLTLAALAVAAVVAGLSVLAAHLIRHPHETEARGRSFSKAAFLLALLQTGGFAALEFFERGVFASGDLGLPLGERVFWVGIMLQVLVAVVGALFLVLFARAITFVARLGRVRRDRRSPSVFVSRSSLVSVPALRMVAGGLSFRGPPALSSL